MMKIKRTTVSAIIKCNNEETFLKECIISIIPFVDEVILIDNNSTDASVEIAKNLNVKVINFQSWPGGNVSLAQYYNWCSDQAKTDYIVKWDADMIAFENYQIKDHLKRNPDALFYSLYDLYGDHKHTKFNIICGPEPYVFKKQFRHYNYHNGIERLPFWGENKNTIITYLTEVQGLHMNLKDTEKYVLREIMKEYRKQRRQQPLADWTKDNYDLKSEIQKMENQMLKSIVPYKHHYPKILDSYLSKPIWEIQYKNGKPYRRLKNENPGILSHLQN